MKKLAIILPTYNEGGNIEKTINKVLEQEKNIPGWEINIVISDDIRTSDKSVEIVKEIIKRNKRIHLIKTDPGLGVGIIEGHKYAVKNIKPDLLMQFDADGQVDPDVLVRLVKAIEEGYTLAIGSRFVKGGVNELSFTRRLFTFGASFFCRVVMGPWAIKEFTNSARAFTPELFGKINLQRLPWRENSFIIQPAFLNEAILAGAKYKEIPLVFKNRLEGYSKNKVFNYTYDVIMYSIEARLRKMGINIPLFKLSRKSKTVVKFGMVGVTGTIVDFFFYKLFINIGGFPPATSKGFSTEIAIINNFFLNNYWTFKHRKTKTKLWEKLGIFNLVSFGGLLIAVFMIKFLHSIYGDGFVVLFGRPIAYNNFYFFATIPFAMIWNFLVNHFVTWKQEKIN